MYHLSSLIIHLQSTLRSRSLTSVISAVHHGSDGQTQGDAELSSRCSTASCESDEKRFHYSPHSQSNPRETNPSSTHNVAHIKLVKTRFCMRPPRRITKSVRLRGKQKITSGIWPNSCSSALGWCRWSIVSWNSVDFQRFLFKYLPRLDMLIDYCGI